MWQILLCQRAISFFKIHPLLRVEAHGQFLPSNSQEGSAALPFTRVRMVVASSRCFWRWPNQNTPSWCVFFTSATARNADSFICSVTHLATENYVLVQLLSLIINSINGRHNFLQEKNNIRLSKITKWSRQCTQCTACCLLLPSTAICVFYLCWESKLYRGEVLKVLTQQKQLSHCFWSSTVATAATARQTSDKSPFMHEADHKPLPSQLDFGSWAQTGT